MFTRGQRYLQDTHVSGHACAEEIKLIYALTRPKFAIPIHGEYRHRIAHAKLAANMGIPQDNVLILSSGNVLEVKSDEAKVIGKVPHGGIMVDGLGVGDVGNIVLRDRQMLSQNGLMIVTLTLSRKDNSLLAGPYIVSRGFVYVRESEDLLEQANKVVDTAVKKALANQNCDWSKIKNVIRDALGDFVWKQTKRNPMILPIIMEV